MGGGRLKAHNAKTSGARYIEVWGSGRPMREFLHVDDLADACVRLMTHYSGEGVVNVGAGYDLTIMELANLICEVIGFDGAIRFDSSKPDGAPRKLLDAGRMRALGWPPRIGLRDGLKQAYAWFLEHQHELRGLVAP